MSKWLVSAPRRVRTLQNVEPTYDLIAHVRGMSCECKPFKLVQMNGIHVLCVQIVHNAVDGRE